MYMSRTPFPSLSSDTLWTVSYNLTGIVYTGNNKKRTCIECKRVVISKMY